MQFIDTHCHLDDSQFDVDRDAVIQRAMQAGIEVFVVPSVEEGGWQILSELSRKSTSIKPAYGLHPWFCERHRQAALELLAERAEKAVAIGECGLDFASGRTPEKEQLSWLRPQLEIACSAGIPVIVHAYKSLDRIHAEIRRYPDLTGVIHSFSGSLQQAEKMIEQGFHLGIGSAVMAKGAKRLREVVQRMPLDRMLLETDAPFQPGPKHSGQRNEPEYLIEIAAEVATIRDISLQELASATLHNSRELFRL